MDHGSHHAPPTPMAGSRWLDIAGVDAHFIDRGRGAPVLMLHGMGATHFTWHRNIPRLETDFHVLAPDLPGYGFTEPPLGFAYSAAAYADFFMAFLDRLAITRTHIVAHSFSGAVAEHMIRERPDRIGRLVLIGSADMERPVPEKRDEKARHLFFRSYHDTSAMDRNAIEVGRQANRGGRVEQTTRAVVAANLNGARRNGRLALSTMILCGRHDAIVSIESCRRLTRHFDDAVFHAIEDAGHVCHEEKPETVTDLIAAFLSRDDTT